MFQKLSNLSFALLVLGFCGGTFLLMQLYPYGHQHPDPPVVATPQWDSPQTAYLAAKACYNCHSNETVWPWYSNMAPVSWMIEQDVIEGREELNFSVWKPSKLDAEHIATVVYVRHMPVERYLPFHPQSRLTDQEVVELSQGLFKTILMAQGNWPPPSPFQPAPQ